MSSAVVETRALLSPVVLESTESLVGLRAEWERLWRRCPTATPFQSPAWLLPWWRHYGDGEPLTLALYKGAELVALAPFYLYRGAGMRQLFLMGISSSDYQDVLVAPGCEEAAVEALTEFLTAHSCRWERVDLRQLRPGSLLLETMPDAGSEPDESCLVQSLSGVKAIDEILPASLLRSLRHAQNRLRRIGIAEIRSVYSEDVQVAVDRLFVLFGARWSGRQPSEAEREAVFLRDAANELHQAGALRLYQLTVNGETAALYFGFQHAGRAYYYLSAFDPRYAKCSPGTLVVTHAITEALREGARDFDFLRGEEGYKLRFGAVPRSTFRRTIFTDLAEAAA